MELEQILKKVLSLDSGPNGGEKLRTLLLEHPQWKDQIAECWEMHRKLKLTRRQLKSELPANWGHYEILDEIDRGGMGVVYRARHMELNRIVALKIIRSGELADELEVARFRREAQVAANLLHPNIIPIYEVGQEKQLVYFTMAFVDGMPLSRLGNNSSLSTPTKIKLVYELAKALQYAHGKGVAHRDIKPSNILVDTQGNPILIDFGLAKLTHAASDLTASGT
ncbi:MAG: serine/threonine-protein kinase, partial [Pirellula sp.]